MRERFRQGARPSSPPSHTTNRHRPPARQGWKARVTHFRKFTAPEPPNAQAIAQLGPWLHNLHLPDGTQTAPDHYLGDFPACQWAEIRDSIPPDLSGWHALDIGCNAGFYTFELAKRGAYVTGIDVNPHYLRQARWAAPLYDLEDRVEFRQMQVYDLAHETRKYDLVLFMGVFHRLRYPLLALDIVAQKARRLMLFQTLTMPGREMFEPGIDRDLNDRDDMAKPGWPKMAFIEHRLAGDPTNWWAPNHSCVEAMLRSSGFAILDRPGEELYLCKPDLDNPSSVTTWNASEHLSATGRLRTP
jgi:tRNA (mo5U34)-methyltransferase